MSSTSRFIGFIPFALIFFSLVTGCDCGRPANVQTFGELGVVWVTDDGVQMANRDATFDFGAAAMGDRIPKKLIVKNLSSGPLTLQTLARTDGDPVTIADAVADGAAFEVQFQTSTVMAGEEAEMDMFFTPPQAKDATLQNEAHEAKLLLTAGGTREDESSAVITLKGSGEAGDCLLPKEINFGAVPVGERFQLGYDLHNSLSSAAMGYVGQPESTTGDHLAFGLAQGSPQGTVEIGPRQSVHVVFEFGPTELRPYEASVKLRAGPQCGIGTVALKGEGVDQVLSWTPSDLNFGFVSPNTLAPKKVTFTNLSNAPVTLTQVATSMASDFAVQAQSGDPTTFVIPGGGVPTDMTVVCKPSQLGNRNATLTFKTGMNKTPSGTITLECVGGGPNIKVTPSPALAFGQVGYYPQATGATATRRITIANVGTPAPAGQPQGNLMLGGVGPNGPGVLPYMALNPTNSNTDASEFHISMPPTYDAATGIQAVVGKNMMDVQIGLQPASIGAKEADLTVFSNDPDSPAVTIHITADVQQLQPCNYSVTPASLNFGLVTPPAQRDLPVKIRNMAAAGGVACELSGIDIAAGSDAAYSIVGGAIASKTLQPGEETQVTVRVAPQNTPPNGGTASISGYLSFNVNAPNPQALVPLSTSIGPSCLTIAPDNLDFGTVKNGCSSTTRTFTAYNTCSTDVFVQSISMSVPAGQPAGGPNCPGTSPCPEFKITAAPSIPAGGLRVQPGASGTSFQAKYQPIDVGADQGAIAVAVTQGGANVTYLVSLAGNGDTTGQQIDSFVQDAQPKADILLVIDNSGSMSDKQNELAQNFNSFLQYANAANVDYHLGVTTTDVDDGGCVMGFCTPPGQKGRLQGDANNPKVLTPYTPNVAQLYSQKVQVGTNGSGSEKGIEGALEALTPPTVSTDNAGFLRSDAKLAVVVVTDAMDQSPGTMTYYLNRFFNVKGFNKANEFSFNAIAPFLSAPPSNCTYDQDAPDNGRYGYMVSNTNGVSAEICNSNWASTLQQLGKIAFGFRTTFFLNTSPSLSSPMTVSIDGVTVPQSAYTYNSATNAIDFDPAHAPAPGQTLTVTYTGVCL